jgi:lysozyme
LHFEVMHMVETSAIVDLSHYNGDVDLVAAKLDGVLGVIHKATQGTNHKDPRYDQNHQRAQQAGLLWGAYHFGTAEDGVAQADYFLAAVSPGPKDLVVLDFERDATPPSMTLDQARAFVTRVHDRIGRWPGLYSGDYVTELLGANHDPVLSRCWLWLARYGSVVAVPPTWQSWTLWQYTDGSHGPDPLPVNGIGRCDRDKFNGDAAALQSFWTELHRTRYA